MIKLLKNVANLNNNFQITVTYQLQFYIISLEKSIINGEMMMAALLFSDL